jgi:hypothetical protein
MGSVKKNQGFINVPDTLGTGVIITGRRVQSAQRSIGGQYECIRILDLGESIEGRAYNEPAKNKQYADPLHVNSYCAQL